MEAEVVKEASNMEVWIPAIVSIITLFVNLLFYLFGQPKITYRNNRKESLIKVSVDLLNYLTDIISFNNFDGVPTQIRKYCLQIHLCFKNGIADGQIELLLEKIFKEVQARKSIIADGEIEQWDENFRDLVRELRKRLAKYCGAL